MTDTACPFTVKVSIPDLGIRKGTPKLAEAHTGKGVFTITEVRFGAGSSLGWGKLKSGTGWFFLDYCTKV